MEETWTLIATLVTLMVVYFYWDFKRKCQYWLDRKVAFPRQGMSSIGAILSIFTKVPMSLRIFKVYNDFPNEKFVGLNSLSTPNILVRDPAFLEKIMVKDFHHFTDHDRVKLDKDTIMNLGLFNLTGNEWRSYRSKLSPTFTTGKLKNMFDGLLPCGDALVENMGKGQINHDMKDNIMTYAMEVSAAVIFGIELQNEELRSKYKQVSNELFNFSPGRVLSFIILAQFPRLGHFLKLKILKSEHETFFRDIIAQTFQQRRTSGSQRNDYVQLLLKLKEMGHLEVKNKDPDDNYLQSDQMLPNTEQFEVSDLMLTAQAFQFLSGGFEPIYNTMLFALYELAQSAEIQDKVRKEIKEVKDRNQGYSYKTVREMTFLEQCVQETLRKHPVFPFLSRYCVKDYRVNEYFTIEKGTQIHIPIMGIHHDPAYYPDPEKFDPERFNPDSPPQNFIYIPFGGGPRVCIAMRYAMMEMKFGLAKIIENYKFTLGDKNETPIALNPTSFFLSPRSMYLNLERI